MLQFHAGLSCVRDLEQRVPPITVRVVIANLFSECDFGKPGVRSLHARAGKQFTRDEPMHVAVGARIVVIREQVRTVR